MSEMCNAGSWLSIESGAYHLQAYIPNGQCPYCGIGARLWDHWGCEPCGKSIIQQRFVYVKLMGRILRLYQTQTVYGVMNQVAREAMVNIEHVQIKRKVGNEYEIMDPVEDVIGVYKGEELQAVLDI